MMIDKTENTKGRLAPFTQPKRKMCWWITEKCNEGCVYCFRSLSAKDTFDFDGHMAILDRILEFGTEQITWSGGEALLVEHVPRLMAYAKQHGIFNKVTTNGKLLTPEKIEEVMPYTDLVALSIDSLDDEVNRILGRGSEHRKTVIDRIGNLMDAGIDVDVNTVVMRPNIGTLDDMARFFSQHPISGKWKLMTFFPVRERALENKGKLEVDDDDFIECVHRLIEAYPDIDIKYMLNDQIQQQYPGVRANGDLLVTRHAKDRIIGNLATDAHVQDPFEID